MMSKPIAVLISDIHYSVPTLELADAAMRQAIAEANRLDLPLIVAGDLHDSKANVRGECIKAMRDTLKLAKRRPWVIVGNHCRINEKSIEHALHFLEDLTHIVAASTWCEAVKSYLVAYHHNPDSLRFYLSNLPMGCRIIMHQGIQDSNSGEYIQDRSAITHDDVKDFRVISGHYHQRQDIKTGRPQKGAVGLFSYIGSPYTMNFGEANDGPKGFQILMDDGTLEFIPTNLRKHVVYALDADVAEVWQPLHSDTDLIRVKMKGTKERLAGVTKVKVAYTMGIKQDFRLDLIPTDNESRTDNILQTSSMAEVLDQLIDSLSASSIEQKNRVKALWKELK